MAYYLRPRAAPAASQPTTGFVVENRPGDRTAIELFLEDTNGWEFRIRRLLVGSAVSDDWDLHRTKPACQRAALRAQSVTRYARYGDVSMSTPATQLKNIVLVHGAFADGSCWLKIIPLLLAKGFKVSVVQNPLSSLADDVTAVNRVLSEQDGPVLLVGHSWGGAVITESGNDAKVVGLVYVAAGAPDSGQSFG